MDVRQVLAFGGSAMTRPQQLVATAVLCSIAVGVVTWLMTDGSAQDWWSAALCVGAVVLGTLWRWVSEDRKQRRKGRAD